MPIQRMRTVKTSSDQPDALTVFIWLTFSMYNKYTKFSSVYNKAKITIFNH